MTISYCVENIARILMQSHPIPLIHETQVIDGLAEVVVLGQQYQVQIVFEPRDYYWVPEGETKLRINIMETDDSEATQLAAKIVGDGQSVRAISEYIDKTFNQLQNANIEFENNLSVHSLYESLRTVLEMYERNLKES